jgi:hypothetical protein
MSRPLLALAAFALSISGFAVADQADLGPLAPSSSSQIETGLEGYRFFADEPLKDWQDANKEAFEAAVEMGLPGTYANRPPGTVHAGHGMPGDHPEPTK